MVSSGANLDPQGLTAQSYAQTQASRPPDLFGHAERADYAAVYPVGIGHLEIFGGKPRELWLQHPTPDELNVAMLRTSRCPVVVVAGDRDEIKLERALLI